MVEVRLLFHLANSQTSRTNHSSGAETPSFGPSKLVDFELEMAFITTDANELGNIPVDEAEVYFGLVLFNDWSARYSKMGICTIRTFFG